MRAVHAHDRCPVFFAIVQRYFNLAAAGNGVGDNVIVGKYVAIAINNEARALTFLRYQPVKEIKSHCF